MRSVGKRSFVAGVSVAVLALSGCAAASDEDAGSSSGESEEKEFDPANFDGLVTLNKNDDTLEDIDPESGESNVSLEFASSDRMTLYREMFSQDWRYVATGGSDVQVRKLNPDTGGYETVLELGGGDEQSYSGGSVEYKTPRFSPDGKTLWFEVFREDDSEITLEYIDYANASEGDEPTASDLKFPYDPETETDSHEYWRFVDEDEPVLTDPSESEAVGGEDEPRAKYWLDGDDQVTAANFYDGVGDEGECEELGLLDDGDVLVRDCDDMAIAQASIDAEADKVSLTEVVPEGETPISRAFLSPDRETALLVAGNENPQWYTAKLDDSGSEPEPVDDAPVDLNISEVLAWQ